MEIQIVDKEPAASPIVRLSPSFLDQDSENRIIQGGQPLDNVDGGYRIPGGGKSIDRH